MRRSLTWAALLFCVANWVLAADSPAARVVENSGFVDIDLPIEQIIPDRNIVRVIARGRVADGDVGLEVDFPLPGKAVNTNGIPLSFGKARIRSLGAASDRLVSVLAARYRVSTVAKRMLQSIDAEAAGLGDDGANALRGKKDMKFFFYSDGPEDRYAELYVNIDFDNRILEIHEKDPDYRKGVILALTKRQ